MWINCVHTDHWHRSTTINDSGCMCVPRDKRERLDFICQYKNRQPNLFAFLVVGWMAEESCSIRITSDREQWSDTSCNRTIIKTKLNVSQRHHREKNIKNKTLLHNAWIEWCIDWQKMWLSNNISIATRHSNTSHSKYNWLDRRSKLVGSTGLWRARAHPIWKLKQFCLFVQGKPACERITTHAKCLIMRVTTRCM